jgi:hypothetical protein
MRKTQTKSKIAHHKHIRKLHALRISWFIFLAVGHIAIQLISYNEAPKSTNQKVLAYATNVTVNGLAAAQNQARAANGLGALAINSALNNSAQAKAQHMIANNYWAHTAPDGTEPWYFFTLAGYDYAAAGENLAYGFDNNSEIIDAWMGSTGHRANILGNYKDMGFGFASGANYQGGEYTVVVAHYGTQQTPAPAPAKSTPKVVASAPAPTPTPPAPIPEPTPAPTPEPVTSAEEPKSEPKAEPATSEATAQPVDQKRVTNLQNLLSGNAGWPMYASLGFVGMSTVGFITTHIALIRRTWKQSKHFILVHPAFDAAVLIALVATLLTTTVGFIR